MNNSIIFFLISLHILCMPKMSTCAECCTPINCDTKSSSSDERSLSIEFPFRVKDQQPKSCGSPGFDIHCDSKLGPLLELPNAGNFTVGTIYQYRDSRRIELLDDCLPQKLLKLDLTTTPWRVISLSQDFKVYNCSGIDDFDISYNGGKIDCLSGSNYTVIGARSSSTVTYSNCRFLKNVSVPSIPGLHETYLELNSYSSIYLTWDEQTCTLRGSGMTFYIFQFLNLFLS